MPMLTLYFKENNLGDYILKKGQSLTIGRKETNDISIENLAVSGHHAKIDSEGDGFKLTDLQSKNGSFVNNEPVSTCWLKHGDSITIGKHHLIFAYGEDEERPDSVFDGMEQTTLDGEAHKDIHARPASKKTGDEKGTEDPTGLLKYLSGGEGIIRLTQKITKLGKNPTSDIVLGGLLVGPTAAAISKGPKGYSLSYVGGIAKPKVNGEVVKEWVTLNELDIVELGSVKFEFSTEK